jgi:hypothetical protein
MKNKNHNIRFNTEKADENRAWELLHSQEVRQSFKSQNRFVIEAINDYYDRHIAKMDDPYLETREKEDAFADRIVEQVERKVLSNLPGLLGMFMAQIQSFSVSSPLGAVKAGNPNGEMPQTQQTTVQENSQDTEDPEQLPENEFLNFNLL